MPDTGTGIIKGGAEQAEHKSSIWIVSFGELLTLLLCFFLLAMSLSPLNPAVRSARDKSGTIIDKSGTNNATSGAPGTRLAISKIEGGDLTLLQHRFAPGDFDQSSGALSESGLEKAKRIVVPEGYDLKRISVEFCSTASAEGELGREARSLSGLMSIKRQLFGAGFEKSSFRLAPESGSCSEAEWAGGIAAEVNLELEGLGNG